MFIGRAYVEAETLILWPPDVKNWLIGKDPDAGKDWRQEEMAGWHHWLNGHAFEQAPGDGEGQGSLACCSLWGRKESDTTEWLNHNNNPTKHKTFSSNIIWDVPVRVFIRMSCCSVAQSRLSLCEPMDCSTRGFPVLHHLPELAQTHVHWVCDAIQPSCPLSSPSPSVFNLSQHQGLFQWVNSYWKVLRLLKTFYW